jgi:vacuolar protein sorting-associated protein 29
MPPKAVADLAFQVQGDVLVLYVYQLKTDANGIENVSVEKVSFRKMNEALPAS